LSFLANGQEGGSVFTPGPSVDAELGTDRIMIAEQWQSKALNHVPYLILAYHFFTG